MDLQTTLHNPEFSEFTAEQALAFGNESVVIAEETSRWSYAGVAQRFGTSAAEAIGAAMQAAGLSIGVTTYATVGIALNDPQTQVNLAAIASSPAGTTVVDNNKTLTQVCNELMEIGITHGTRWQFWGVPQPTVEDITAAMARNTAAAWAASVWNELIQPGINAGKSIEQLKADIAGA